MNLLTPILFLFFFPVFCLAQPGRVGINTTTPAAMLHVKDSSVVFTGKVSYPGGEGSMPVSGTGARMLWHPGKAAFRAGYINGPFWDKDSVGILSVATGFNTTASGEFSMSFGRTAVARGFSARSMGYKTRAIGDHSTAIGDSSFALGINSIAMGHHSLASASFSCAIGHKTTASGNYSLAFGDETIASGTNAFATGLLSIASGNGSTAMGKNTIASGALSTAMGGFNSAIGASSIAMGLSSEAYGGNSIAIGTNLVANGFASVVLGVESETTSDWGIAIGSNARATTDIATSIGWYTTASGPASVALGSNTLASGSGSLAMGNYTKASGVNAQSCGTNTIAKPYGSFVLGRFNDTTTISTNNWNNLDALFIVGNGQDHDTRSNAMTILKNGNVGIGPDVTPSQRLHVSNDHPGDGGWTYGMMVENTNASTGEVAVSFRNKSIPSNKQWSFGLNQSPSLAFSYGTNFSNNNSMLYIDTLGQVGIGTTAPEASLDIDGTTIIGINGSELTHVIRASISKDLPSMAANTIITETFPVPNSTTGSTVYISPSLVLPDGLIIAYARVSVSGTVEVKFVNVSGGIVNATLMNYEVTVIK